MEGHASLWWDKIQEDKVKNGKNKINTWDRMVSNFKDKFLPIEYVIYLFRKLQNLR